MSLRRVIGVARSRAGTWHLVIDQGGRRRALCSWWPHLRGELRARIPAPASTSADDRWTVRICTVCVDRHLDHELGRAGIDRTGRIRPRVVTAGSGGEVDR